MAQRSAWRERLKHVDVKRLVFLDESGAKTNMTRLYARSKKGQRALDYAPREHWNTTTMVAGVTWSAPIAPMVLDGPMDADAFEAYVAQVLAPALPPASIVVMDNLSPHKTASIEPTIQNAQSELWYLPPYSPDVNPIEHMWSQIKSHLRSARAEAKEELWSAVAAALAKVTPEDTQGYFLDSVVGIIN